MQNYIFDFDGTIADSLTHIVAIFNEFFPDKQIAPEEVDEYRKLTSRQAIKKSGIPLWRIPGLLTKGLKSFKAMLPHIDPFPEMPATLKALKKDGKKVYMLTSNNEDAVRQFLDQHKLTEYFDGLYCGSSLFGKAAFIRRIIREQHLERDQTIYIGDETRDIDAARRAGVKSVAVAWGFNHPMTLEKHHPDVLILEPKELLDLK